MQIILAFLAGLLGGLLVNYLADVLPVTRRLSRPPWWPLTGQSAADYLARGRVRWVLLAFLAFALALALYPPIELSASLIYALLLYFGVVVVIDIEHRAILHQVSLAGALWFLIWGILRRGWLGTLLGGAVGFGVMLLLYYAGDWLGAWLARRRGEAWEDTALGFGDVYLAGVIGLLLGWPSIIAGLTFAILAGGLFSAGFLLVMLLRGRYQAFASIPYGPFLALGAMVLILLRAYSL